ncbi:hypothetical protein [Dyella telluris]|uniref:Uncharacterized protein n=1 Tax=Dyella telluris TaxID=2763498 RepID=A0A7G8Q4H4_9GAMM|nr:hypothetical protein [Dyella telluris]QNK01682.1 hypothetical protein H8F01_00435 [Dyella telluris]
MEQKIETQSERKTLMVDEKTYDKVSAAAKRGGSGVTRGVVVAALIDLVGQDQLDRKLAEIAAEAKAAREKKSEQRSKLSELAEVLSPAEIEALLRQARQRQGS